MNENGYTDLAIEVARIDSRSKSNEKRLTRHDEEIKEIKDKQEAIYELTSSVKSIAIDMSYIKKDIGEVKDKQQDLHEKVVTLENKPAQEAKKRTDSLLDKIIWLIVGGALTGLLSLIIPNIKW